MRYYETCERTSAVREGRAGVAPAIPFVNRLHGGLWRAGTHLKSSKLQCFLANVVGVEGGDEVIDSAHGGGERGEGIWRCGGEGYAGCARGAGRGRCSNTGCRSGWDLSHGPAQIPYTGSSFRHLRTVVRLLRWPRRWSLLSSATLGLALSGPPFRRRVVLVANTHTISVARFVCPRACRSNSSFTTRPGSHVGTAFQDSLSHPGLSSSSGFSVLSWPARRGGRDDMDESTRIRIRYGQVTHGTPLSSAHTFHARHGPRFFSSGCHADLLSTCSSQSTCASPLPISLSFPEPCAPLDDEDLISWPRPSSSL